MPTPVLVHDYLLVLRGAERTFAAMADVWPEAPIATLLYDEAGTAGRFAGRVRADLARCSVLGVEQRNFRALLPLLPFAAAALPVDDARRDRLEQQRVRPRRAQAPRGAARLLLPLALPLRLARARPGPGRGLAAPAARAGRPPAPPPGLRPPRRGPGRPVPRQLAAHARADPPLLGPRLRRRPPAGRRRALRARRAGRAPPLRRRARRPQARRRRDRGRGGRRAADPGRRGGARARAARGPLRRPRASSSGACPTTSSQRVYATAAALVVPNVEEFGIAAVEAQAAGRPVVAVDAGGVRETVVDGRTGVLVPPGDRDALVRALRGDFGRFDGAEIRRHAAALLARGVPGAAGRRRRRHDRPARRAPRGLGLAGQGAHAARRGHELAPGQARHPPVGDEAADEDRRVGDRRDDGRGPVTPPLPRKTTRPTTVTTHAEDLRARRREGPAGGVDAGVEDRGAGEQHAARQEQQQRGRRRRGSRRRRPGRAAGGRAARSPGPRRRRSPAPPRTRATTLIGPRSRVAGGGGHHQPGEGVRELVDDERHAGGHGVEADAGRADERRQHRDVEPRGDVVGDRRALAAHPVPERGPARAAGRPARRRSAAPRGPARPRGRAREAALAAMSALCTVSASSAQSTTKPTAVSAGCARRSAL